MLIIHQPSSPFTIDIKGKTSVGYVLITADHGTPLTGTKGKIGRYRRYND
jgi:hypothetical protein